VRVRVLLLHQLVKLVNITYYLAIGCHMFLFVIEKIGCCNLIALVHCSLCSWSEPGGLIVCSHRSLSRFTSNFGIKEKKSEVALIQPQVEKYVLI